MQKIVEIVRKYIVWIDSNICWIDSYN